MNQIASLPRPVDAVEQPQPIDVQISIASLLDGHALTQAQSAQLFGELVAGRLPEPLMAAAFTALRLKGETAEELTGAAVTLREAAVVFPRPDYLFADSCGTGGDGSGSINISTATALLAAACGLPIVKHGNRSFTSRCGSADVLEALGARLDLEPNASRALLDELGFCFLLAPQYHPGIAHAGPVRRALKTRTIMNLLGPCLNPARPPVQLLGVAELPLLLPIAEALRALGVRRALVVHGSGLDEVALHGPTAAVRLVEGLLEQVEITPEEAGLPRAPVETIAGGDPADNGRRLKALLNGLGSPSDGAVVALNCGALLCTAGLVGDLRAGVERSQQVLQSGAAGRLLDRYLEASRG